MGSNHIASILYTSKFDFTVRTLSRSYPVPERRTSAKVLTIHSTFLRCYRKIAKSDLSCLPACLPACLSVCLSVCPSVCLHGTTRLPLAGLSWNLILEYFSNICRENRRFIFNENILLFLCVVAQNL